MDLTNQKRTRVNYIILLTIIYDIEWACPSGRSQK